jgi:competence protein ComEC
MRIAFGWFSGLLALALLAAPVHGGQSDGRLDVYWIDVEGGAATLIVTPDNESVLIDTGNPGLRDAPRITQLATKVAGLRAIDHLITTHYHRDHYGGAELLSTMLPIGRVYDNGVFDGMPDNPGKAYFNFRCNQRNVIQPGDVISLRQGKASENGCKLQCLAARKTFVEPQAVGAKPNEDAGKLHKPKDRDGSDNANSVVMLLSFGDFQFFDGGDVTWNQEKNLVHPYNLVGEVDVYQVTHHGLDSSNNPIVLQSLKPRVAIMNNGHTKGCAPDVFANLKAVDSLEAIYQVHKNLRPDGAVNNVDDAFIANHQAADQCQGNYIKLSVAPDGKSYRVSIPANGHEQTYQTK